MIALFSHMIMLVHLDQTSSVKTQANSEDEVEEEEMKKGARKRG